jgi:pimeloyl-ACP methyl ester carboxylesterase
MKYLHIILIGLAIGCTSQKKQEASFPEIYNLGSRINYQVAGSGDTTLLFVHGWCINQSYWNQQVDHFKDRYQVVTLDLPGHGNSDKNRNEWTIENFGKDIVMLMDALELKNVVLIGHSMGGNIILEAALSKPEVVIGFVGVDNFQELGVLYTEAQKEELSTFFSQMKTDYGNVVSGFAAGMLFAESTPKGISDRVLNDILSVPPEISVGILESLSTVNEIEGEQMQRLDLKVHLINCDRNPVNIEQLDKYCQRSYQVHPIGNLGHYPMVEAPEKFNDILEEILLSL